MMTEEMIIVKYNNVTLWIDLLKVGNQYAIDKIWIGNQEVTKFLNVVDVLGLVYQEIKNELTQLNR